MVSLVDSPVEKEGTKSESLTEQLIDQIVSGTYPAGSKISEPEQTEA